MAAKSQDPMMEGLKRMMQVAEGAGAPLAEPPAGAGSGELENLFLEELRSRRERLARWMQLIQEEVAMEAAPARSRRRHHCRLRSAPARFRRGL